MIRTPIRVRLLLPALLCLALPAAISAQAKPDSTKKKQKGDSSQTLPGVSVTASKPTPAAGELTAADIGRFDGVSLIGPINTIPGVFMQTRTPYGGARITLRGYYPSTSGNSPNSNGLGYQVFLNGIPITDATGTTVLDDIDYSTLGKVEVIKGPNSSRYGSFIGGTVLMETARPDANANELSQQALTGTDGHAAHEHDVLACRATVRTSCSTTATRATTAFAKMISPARNMFVRAAISGRATSRRSRPISRTIAPTKDSPAKSTAPISTTAAR